LLTKAILSIYYCIKYVLSKSLAETCFCQDGLNHGLNYSGRNLPTLEATHVVAAQRGFACVIMPTM